VTVPVAVASGHPLATQAALAILRCGGSAVDAAIAADAVMGVVEPIATGVGGDVMAVVVGSEQLAAYNGSGRAGAAAANISLTDGDHGYVKNVGGQAVTVPGAVAGWWDLHQRFGALPWAEVLAPAMAAASDGAEVGPVTAAIWAAMESRLDPAGKTLYLPGGAAPAAGARWRNPELADTLAALAAHGPDHFYRGPLAHELAAAVQDAGGPITAADLAAHRGEWVDPLRRTVAGLELVTVPPPGQGVVVLLAAAQLDERVGAPESAAGIVMQVEALDRAFGVAVDVVADGIGPLDLDELLAEARRRPTRGPLPYAPGTVFTAVARGGEFVSFISSVCDRFGAGVTVPGRGFVLQSRGRGFSLDPAHKNGVAGGRRPYHTIVPTIGLRDGRPVLALGVVGGVMQPQGQLQVLAHLLRGVPAQTAVDAPRFRLQHDGRVALEPGLPEGTGEALQAAGYDVVSAAGVDFGGAQVVMVGGAGELTAGSDHRKDGAAASEEVPPAPGRRSRR
jgi:gamma-glutamyltranspeptidase/glutathione hydrolase